MIVRFTAQIVTMQLFKIFRIFAHLEGYSFLALIFIAMPMKYMWHDPMLIRPIGMVHGLLFVIYVIIAIVGKKEWKWDWFTFGNAIIASLLPFGTFVFLKLHPITRK